ncbi:TPA: hypothetical protein DDW35_11330 [Candidatus Sumerlaeota bacterium]|jgi:lyso-ornithine lipid O-acyltransferase|nr:hypothetical protein [Candidatus Sumerlaeota bacterium]
MALAATQNHAEAVRRAKSNPFLAAVRIPLIVCNCLFFVWGFVLFKTVCRCMGLAKPNASIWVSVCSRVLCFLMGIKARVSGDLPPSGCLLTPNHTGYVDICALASVAPCLFVPKREVASWPLIGLMVRSAEFPTVSRMRSKDLAVATQQIRERLETNQSVCVFLEGTSSGGEAPLPFFAPLLQPALESAAPVVPVGIRYSTTHPEIQISEDVAYWKDHTFGPHILRLLGLRGVEVEIGFGLPQKAMGCNRKEFAGVLHEQVVELCKGA